MSKGRKTVRLDVLQEAARDEVLGKHVTARLAGVPVETLGVTPPGMRLALGGTIFDVLDPRPVGTDDLSKPADWEHRTTVADIRAEAREELRTRFPEWQELVGPVLDGRECDASETVRESIMAGYLAIFRVLRETLPADRPRKSHRNRPDSLRRQGESSPVVTRYRSAPAVREVGGRKVTCEEAAQTLTTFDPHRAAPGWLGTEIPEA